MPEREWRVVNPDAPRRVVVTKELPGERWQQLLTAAACRVEVALGADALGEAELRAAIGGRCAAVIGQLTEPWTARLLGELAAVGGAIYSQYAVGYDNVDVPAATRLGLPVGNTPGVLTETTAELAVALTFAAARRIAEGDRCMRHACYTGWLPSLMLGKLLWRGQLGIVGAGRIGVAYARMLMEGHRMSVTYFDPRRSEALENAAGHFDAYLRAQGEEPITCRRAATLQELLRGADVVSVHAALTPSTHHLIGEPELAAMKHQAILVNAARGPLVDEAALAEHCRTHPRFAAGLDVYEHEPRVHPGLVALDNVVMVPHLGSATEWTRQGMAVLAAHNTVAALNHWPVWPVAAKLEDVLPFIADPHPPQAAPSIVNAEELGLARYRGPAAGSARAAGSAGPTPSTKHPAT
jgi:glycerate dehydrogenase